ncbi:MAG TPA: NAD(P)-dependent oxidoreductase [Ignavibacteriaceae bacterium]|nr:NAD(P)-dependent oxidoreductase [Ignavibacteriaceae bacterium]
MKILITGGSGLLGQYLNIELSGSNEILSIYNSHEGNCRNFPSLKADINDPEKLDKIFEQFRPESVIHTAAFSSPIPADSVTPGEVYNLNVNTTKKIAELCEKYKAKLLYTSTDLVYAGYRGSMLKEDEKLIPVSLYAETKLMGEIKIQETFNNYLILRIALLFGFGLNHSKCHFQQMYKNLKEGKKVKLFYDQFRTPISIRDSARVINELNKKNLKSEILNAGGLERVSRTELGERLCKTAGFDESLIEKVSMSELPELPQVADVSMNTEKLRSFGIKLNSIDNAIKEVLKNSKI